LGAHTPRQPGSGTPALELQPCRAPFQQWVHNTSDNHLHPSQDAGQCVDFDTSDKHAIIYGCHPGGNQQWLLGPNGTKHIVAFNGPDISQDLCMTSCNASVSEAHLHPGQARCLRDARRLQQPASQYCGAV